MLEWFASAPKESLYLSVLTLSEIRKSVEKLPGSPKKQTLSNWLKNEIPLWFDTAKSKQGKLFTSFQPAASNEAIKRIRQRTRSWNIQ